MERRNCRVSTSSYRRARTACNTTKHQANRKARVKQKFGTKNTTANIQISAWKSKLSHYIVLIPSSLSIFSVHTLNGKKLAINSPSQALKIALERIGATIVDTLHADCDLLVVDPQDNFQSQWRATSMSIPVMTKSYLAAQLDENCLRQRAKKRSLSPCTYFDHSWNVFFRWSSSRVIRCIRCSNGNLLRILTESFQFTIQRIPRRDSR